MYELSHNAQVRAFLFFFIFHRMLINRFPIKFFCFKINLFLLLHSLPPFFHYPYPFFLPKFQLLHHLIPYPPPLSFSPSPPPPSLSPLPLPLSPLPSYFMVFDAFLFTLDICYNLLVLLFCARQLRLEILIFLLL